MPQRRTVRASSMVAAALLALVVVVGAIVWSNRTTPPELGKYAGQPWSGNGLHMPFRWCPPGTFAMGSPATEPNRRNDEEQFKVTLTQGFWLGQTEVTQRQWQSLMGTTPWKGEDDVTEGANYPAVFVSHSDDMDSAVAFCERFTSRERAAGRLPTGWIYRVPTEAEWEYGCRAGTTTAYSFGDDSANLDQHAWFDGNNWNSMHMNPSWLDDPVALCAHRVGTKLANAWGLRDTHGNVFEWCVEERPQKMADGLERLVTNASSGMARGGAWGHPASYCRSAFRLSLRSSFRGYDVGFRVVLSPSGRAAERLDR